jgi:hypothetical protein
MVAVPLRPAEVHPEEHLRPVSRLGPTGAGADRQDRAPLVVLAGEQELRPVAQEVRLERRRVAVQLGREFIVAGLLEQLDGSLEVVGPAQEGAPALDLGSEAVRLAKGALRRTLVVPERGLGGQCLQPGDAVFLGRQVKDAPRSTGSAPPGRGSPQRPLVPDLEILEKDRAKLDQPEGRLAPGDDGVHAGTVGVVRADAAVSVTVESGRIAARSAVPLACDEIDERRFLGLLHKSLSLWRGRMDRGAGGALRYVGWCPGMFARV